MMVPDVPEASLRADSTVLDEGWVEKESRHFGRWRRRWLVLFAERRTQLPTLCTFEEERSSWPAGSASEGVVVPAATETIRLTGATCMVCPPGVARGRTDAFVVHTRTRDFFFACEDAAACKAWVRHISQGIANAVLRLGGLSPTPSEASAATPSPIAARTAAVEKAAGAADSWSEAAAVAAASAGLRVPAYLQQRQAEFEQGAEAAGAADAAAGGETAAASRGSALSRDSSLSLSRDTLEEQNKQLVQCAPARTRASEASPTPAPPSLQPRSTLAPTSLRPRCALAAPLPPAGTLRGCTAPWTRWRWASCRRSWTSCEGGRAS